MATTKLTLYNGALLLCGLRKLSSDTENQPRRHDLDRVYDDPSAASIFLELVKPKFALLTAKLASPTTPTNYDYSSEYTQPSGYVEFFELYGDGSLDQRVERYVIEGDKIACDVPTNVWLRYITDTKALTAWTPMFTNVVIAYLAKEIAPRLAKSKVLMLEKKFLSRIEAAISLEGAKEADTKPTKAVATLTTDCPKI